MSQEDEIHSKRSLRSSGITGYFIGARCHHVEPFLYTVVEAHVNYPNHIIFQKMRLLAKYKELLVLAERTDRRDTRGIEISLVALLRGLADC